MRVKQIPIAEIPSAFSLTVCSAPYRETPVRFEKIRMAEIPSVSPLDNAKHRCGSRDLYRMRVLYDFRYVGRRFEDDMARSGPGNPRTRAYANRRKGQVEGEAAVTGLAA